MTNYSVQIETFLFRRSWGEAFLALTDAQAGELIKAIYLYTEGGEPIIEDTMLRSIYGMMIKQLNISAKKYVQRIGT